MSTVQGVRINYTQTSFEPIALIRCFVKTVTEGPKTVRPQILEEKIVKLTKSRTKEFEGCIA